MAIDRSNSGKRPGGASASGAGVGFHSKRIQAGLSTQIVVSVNEGGEKFTIGAVQKLDYKSSRGLQRINEVGTDAVIGIVPNKAAEYSLSISRIVFDFQRLPQALQREYRHIHAQRRPFDIVVTDYNAYLQTPAGPAGSDFNPDSAGPDDFSGTGATVDTSSDTVGSGFVETTFKNCWFTSMNFSYGAADYMITEDAELYCETVFDSASAVTLAGERDALERESSTSNTASVLSGFDGSAT